MDETPTTPAGIRHEADIGHIKEQQKENTNNIKELFRKQTHIREDVSEVRAKVELFAKHVDECSDEKRSLRRIIVYVGSVIAGGTAIGGHDEAIDIGGKILGALIGGG